MSIQHAKWFKISGIAVVSLLLLETILRWGMGLGSPPLLQSDEDIGYLFQPDQDLLRFGNRIMINRFSQRSDQVDAQPASGTLRILVVGDSVSWGGVQVDQTETYPEQMRHLLAKQLQRPVEVLNASAASWGIGNLKAYLHRYGTLGARLVILQIGTEDLYQPKSQGDFVGKSPFMPDRKPPCALCELFSRYILTGFAKADAIPGFQSYRFAQEQFDRNMDEFQDVVNWVRGQGAEVVVLHTAFLDEILQNGTVKEHLPADARARFFEVCASMQVPVFNLIDAWKNQAFVADCFRDDIHLTAEGDRQVAEGLSAFMQRKVLNKLTASERNP
jgi:lysophospholipase L1-like esterase